MDRDDLKGAKVGDIITVPAAKIPAVIAAVPNINPEQVVHHLNAGFDLLERTFASGLTGSSKLGSMLAGMCSIACTRFGVQNVRNALRALVNEEKFWKGQQEAMRIVIK